MHIGILFQVKCICKDNVRGEQCDTCKDYHYNLQFNNPEGCSKCTCNQWGTNGLLETCDKVSGQCPCKPHVNGQSCALCKDGYTALKKYSMFGCEGKLEAFLSFLEDFSSACLC